MKLYNLGSINDYDWIKCVTICDNINEADILYYSSKDIVQYNEESSDLKITSDIKNIINVFTNKKKNQIFIGSGYITTIIGCLLYDFDIYVKKPSRISASVVYNGYLNEHFYVCHNYPYVNRFNGNNNNNILFYLPSTTLILGIKDNLRKFLGIIFDAHITNRVPDAPVIHKLNDLITNLYAQD